VANDAPKFDSTLNGRRGVDCVVFGALLLTFLARDERVGDGRLSLCVVDSESGARRSRRDE